MTASVTTGQTMQMKKWYRQVLGPILALMLLFLLRPVVDAQQQQQSHAQSNQQQSNVQPGTQSTQYLGSDACIACHEDIYKKHFENTPHFKTTMGKGHGCESCHGPGSQHVEGGGDISKIVSFKNLSRQEASSQCLSCHAANLKQGHFSSSSHASNDIGCLDCHSPHHAKEPQYLLIEKEPTQCYSCHTTAKAEFARPYHHRVDEGLINCSDCHNVHGTTTLRQVKTLPSGDAACVKCHANTRGPFVYEHVPVKTEGCTSCHTPHGSTNPRFLRVSQINLLCLQCHTFPTLSPSGPAHNQSAKYQACTMCHAAIHGSNASNVFFR